MEDLEEVRDLTIDCYCVSHVLDDAQEKIIMGNALGYLRWLTHNNETYAPDRKEDFVETNIGFPCRVVTGNKAVQSVFDIDLFKKEEFFFGLIEIRKDFTEGVCPSVTTNGRIHERNKALILDVIAGAYEDIPASTADAVLSNIATWGSRPADFESKLLAVTVSAFLPTIFVRSTRFNPEDVNLYIKGATKLRSDILAAVTREDLTEAGRGMRSVLEKIKTSERYRQLIDLGTSHGLEEEETTGQLLFAIMFNGVGGIAANLVTSFARLDTISAEDRQELREEALAALRKHGGLTRAALEKMPKIESFVLEVLRASPSPDFWSTIAARPTTVKYTTASGPQEVKIKEGERVYASSYWASRDPAVFDKPDDFVWRRFLGPEGEALRKHHVSFHGRLTDTPAVNNHMCPGKDVALSVLKGSVAILNTFFGWELQEPPVWTGTKVARLGQPDNVVKVKSFWLQHPDDLKEIFPSHFDGISHAIRISLNCLCALDLRPLMGKRNRDSTGSSAGKNSPSQQNPPPKTLKMSASSPDDVSELQTLAQPIMTQLKKQQDTVVKECNTVGDKLSSQIQTLDTKVDSLTTDMAALRKRVRELENTVEFQDSEMKRRKPWSQPAIRAFCPYVFLGGYVCYVFSETWGRRGVYARHSHGCARCKSVVCTPRLAVSGCVHRSLRKW
ncbi:hypothetical protein Bbelb_089340 [Branchiostoma belcheri]|nr:hypothetical protein Bbelb_089340 [Branchiostoma belcheri]